MSSVVVGFEKTGYHGCDGFVADKVLLWGESLHMSTNDYDWLGHGIYFWENNPIRAWDWAQRHPNPAVLGARIKLGRCLDLLQPKCVDTLRRHYEIFLAEMTLLRAPLPKNTSGGRHLDCAVIEHLHRYRLHYGKPPFDSLRCAFEDGEPIFPGSLLRTLTHVQLCVRNHDCILSYFLVDRP
ncbi:MAG: hypothetical protein LBK75_10725 [Oscillospiraceae bacterium]|jgi:hypothetical protein|nr:hypothetical protein [Oscillospiraceae bacterium]